MEQLTEYEYKALRYAERHGVIEYVVQGSTMAYMESYPTEGTYYSEVDLNTLKERRGRVTGYGHGQIDERSNWFGDFYHVDFKDGTSKRVKQADFHPNLG